VRPIAFRLANTEAVPPDTGQSDDWRGDGLVLVVEDEARVLRFARDMLTALGFDVLAAEDGSGALDLLRHHRDRLTLVLLDLTLPGMTGEQFLAELERAAVAVPIVVFSGYDADDLGKRLAGRQVAGYLQKPFRLAELRAAVRHALAAN